MSKIFFIIFIVLKIFIGGFKAEANNAFEMNSETYYDETEDPLRKGFIGFIDLTNNFIDTCLPLNDDFGLYIFILIF